MWNPSEHSDEENLRWCYLRAIEWAALPAFLSQLFAPVLLIFVSWKLVVAGIVGAQLAWSPVRYRLINPRFAYWAASIVIMCKWLVAAPIGIYLILHSQKLAGALALSWPLVAGALGVFPPVLVGKLQGLFMTHLEYMACTDSLDKKSEPCQGSRQTSNVGSIPEPCFPIGRYRIDTTIAGLQGLWPLSRAELIALNPGVEFEGERILHAPPADFMSRSWDTILGTVNSAIYKIAIQRIAPRSETVELYREILVYCTRRYGKAGNTTQWRTSDGNIIVDVTYIGGEGILNVFATSRKVRWFTRLRQPTTSEQMR